MSSRTGPANRRRETSGRISEILLITPTQRSVGARYVVAAVAVSIAFGLRYVAPDELIDRLPFTFFIPATLLAAWYGGFGPGLLAFVGGLMLGDYFFLEPHRALGPLSDVGRLATGVYTVTCLAGMSLLQLLHTTNLDLEQQIERARRQADDPQYGVNAEPEESQATRYGEMLKLISGILFATPAKRSVSSRYLVAIGAVTIGFALRYLVSDEVIHRLAFVFFVPAIFFAIWYGGIGPGLVAMAGGLLLANYFFLMPGSTSLTRLGLAIGTYTITCLIWMASLELLYATHRKLEHETERLRQQPDDTQRQPQDLPPQPDG
ncbi:MAG: DUF4118 domain-containing protein [Betaproteobacteria bacterium]|nr:DUF4118 domain-containing protein [Betaproteobacteria bacterium]